MPEIELRINKDDFKAKLGIKDGKNGKDGKTPVKGVDYFDGQKGDPGESIVGLEGPPGPPGESIKGDPGKDGLDGSPDTAFEVRDKLQTLSGGDRLDASYIKNLPKPKVYNSAGRAGIIGVGVYQITVGPNPPLNPSVGDLWVDTN